MRSVKAMFVGVLAAGLILPTAGSAQIRAGFLGAGTILPGNDDGSTGLVGTGFTLNFFGATYSSLYVNNNGNVTFDGPLSTYTPFPLLTTSTKIIAPFFGDVDTRGAGSAKVEYGTGLVGSNAAFFTNWNGVGYYSVNDTPLNYFQLVLIDRSADFGAGDFDIEFNYGAMGWEAGEASGDDNGNGICDPDELSCSPARAGYANGGSATYEIPGSGVNGGLIDGNLNPRYVFEVRNGEIIDPPTTVPEPITMTLMGTGLAGVAAARRRRKNAEPKA